MKHLAIIQSEFLKCARKWEDLSHEEQQGYLKRHPKSKRRLTGQHQPEIKPEQQKPIPTKQFNPGDKMIHRYKGAVVQTPVTVMSYDPLTNKVKVKSDSGKEVEVDASELTDKPMPSLSEFQELSDRIPKPVETKPANSMTKKQIFDLLSENMHSQLSYSNKKGGFVFKQGYFYRHSGSPEKLADRVVAKTKALGLTPRIEDTSDNWHTWPKDSWFEAVISFDQMKKKSSESDVNEPKQKTTEHIMITAKSDKQLQKIKQTALELPVTVKFEDVQSKYGQTRMTIEGQFNLEDLKSFLKILRKKHPGCDLWVEDNDSDHNKAMESSDDD